jgi:hypothetical protein
MGRQAAPPAGIALAELARFSADHRLRPFGRQLYQARPPSALAEGWSIRRSASRKSVGRSLSRARLITPNGRRYWRFRSGQFFTRARTIQIGRMPP